MNNNLLRSIATLSLPLVMSTSLWADIRDDYELTVASAAKAIKGWQLYEVEKFAGSFSNGHYTDPDPNTKVKDFWSDGLIAKLDRDNNGHFETIFVVAEKQLVYAGSIGPNGNFIDAAHEYENYIGQRAAALTRDIRRRASD
jgi:hypothetical protein